MRLSKKCFDARATCYTRGALETFLPGYARDAGSNPQAGSKFLPSSGKVSGLKRFLSHLAAVLLLVPATAKAEIISYIDERGRRIFVNTEETGPAPAVQSSRLGLRLIARRVAQMPGIGEHIEVAARTHRIDPRLVHAIIEVESSWDSWAVSRKGAVGLMQLLPETGRRFGARNLLDPRQNVLAGIRYLRSLLDRFANNLELSLAAYNAGENVVAELGRVPPYPETRDYVERVGALYNDNRWTPVAGSLGAISRDTPARIYTERDENGRIIFTNF